MKIMLLATGAILAAATAAPALAQDADTGASAFTGPRAEFFGSWARGESKTRSETGTSTVRTKGHKDALVAGALGGYDMPIGDKLVVGAFGSYALSTARTCVDASQSSITGCLKAGREIEGGGRIGAKTLNDKALLYVKGAYVNSELRGRFVDAADQGFGGHKNTDGWRAGAGVEYALNPHFYTKVEYDYTKFRNVNGSDIGLADTRIRMNRNQVEGGFGVRF